MSGYVYFAHPIDQAQGRSDLVTLVGTELDRRRVPTYQPSMAWGNLRPPFSPVVAAANNLALGGSSLVLAVLERGIPTLGVPMELQRANDLDIPLVVVADFAQADMAALGELRVREWVHLWDHPSCTSAAITAISAVELLLSGEDAASPLEEALAHPELRQAGLSAGWMRHHPSAVAPLPGAHEGDAGYDLTSTGLVMVHPGKTAKIPCSISVELPEGYWAMVQGRSSSWKRGLLVKGSVIDNGYRGQLWVDVYNLTNQVIQVRAGERIGQLILMPLVHAEWVEVEALSESDRGANGYGSTGR